MKIIYSPEYDGENQLPLTPEKPCLLNTTYVGHIGLLAQLELRMGLSAPTVSDVEREADYLCVLHQHKSGTFYEKAADCDEMGTAHKLLQWRDALVMAGWTPEIKIESDKLTALAELEQDFHTKGMSDRWLDVAGHAQKYGIICPELEIEVDVEQRFLPQLIQQTLLTLADKGVKVSYRQAAETEGCNLKTLLQGKTLQILELHDTNEAYEWFANNDHEPDTVVVNQDTDMLNHVLASWNKPQSQAKTSDGNPQITQLFKLGLSLFERPLNVMNLLSYLEIPVHPIPSGLRHQLVYALCTEGGFHDKWNKELEEYKFDKEDETKDAARRKETSVFWKMVEDHIETVEEHSEILSREKIQTFNRALLNWSKDRLHYDNTDAITRQQLNTLISFCKAFDKLIENTQELDNVKLAKLIHGIYRPCSYVKQETQQHAFTTLTDIHQLAAPTDYLIWLDCLNRPAPADPYDFLYACEREALNEIEGVHIPDYISLLHQQHQALLRTLGRIKKGLTVIIPTFEGNEKSVEHHFISELKMAYGNDYESLKVEPEFKTQPVELPTDVREPQETYELSESIAIPEREQSNSSIDKLIQHPFDYVMEYIAHLKEPNLSELKDIRTSKGLAAHLYIEELVKEGKNNLTAIRTCFEEHYEEQVRRAILETGSVLLLKENWIERANFIQQLRESTDTLLTIWEKLELRPVDCEVEVPVKNFFGFGSFKARIDCLLKNKKGEYVIFDFKWAKEKNYREKIEKGKDMQLQLYKWAIENTDSEYRGRVAATGYYLFPLCKLVTSDFVDTGEGFIKHIEEYKSNGMSAEGSLIDQIHHSIDFRKAQLKNKLVEEAEEMPLVELDYTQNTEEKKLYPLDPKYTEKDDKLEKQHKASPYVPSSLKKKFDHPSIEETPTTHAILKARLK